MELFSIGGIRKFRHHVVYLSKQITKTVTILQQQQEKPYENPHIYNTNPKQAVAISKKQYKHKAKKKKSQIHCFLSLNFWHISYAISLDLTTLYLIVGDDFLIQVTRKCLPCLVTKFRHFNILIFKRDMCVILIKNNITNTKQILITQSGREYELYITHTKY